MRVLAAVLVAAAVLPAGAAAHVQVTPATAAPGDPVLFELLVPNERTERTVEVALQVPKGVLVFSVEGTPGWTRTNQEAADGSLGVIRWKGRLAKDGFARFAFLASTPEQAGTIAWKAVQTYDDGEATRWIGAKGAEEPAAFTTVSADAPRQNAGGEGEPTAQVGDPDAGGFAGDPVLGVVRDDGTDRDPLALALGGAGLLLGAAALTVALRKRT